jgi:hypothetical protein
MPRMPKVPKVARVPEVHYWQCIYELLSKRDYTDLFNDFQLLKEDGLFCDQAININGSS